MKPFFIALNSQNTSGGIDINPENEPLLRAMNRNMFYYYFCVDIKDFIFQKPDPKTNILHYAILPKFLCIKTYYPCLTFYSMVFKEITDYITGQRVAIARYEKAVSEGTLAKLTNLKFEFEDFRIEKMSTKGSHIIVGLSKAEIGKELPKEVGISSIGMSFKLPVKV
jgi:hypothetical protein